MIDRLARRILYRDLGYLPRRRAFVFGTGLSKTATSSLNAALITLGLDAVHLPPCTRVENGKIRLDWPWWLSKAEAATDLSVAAVYRELDATFPNARFIHTRRDRDRWLDSCRRHFTEDLARRRREQGNHWVHALSAAFYGSHLYDEALFGAAYDRHEAEVAAYFAGRSDFLSVDLTRDPDWEPICAFLDRPVPDKPFPFENRGRRDPSDRT